jgi:putative transposase
MNPVRAGMAKHPGEYRWSSYPINGQGKKSALIGHHLLYHDLARLYVERQKAFVNYFAMNCNPVRLTKFAKPPMEIFLLVTADLLLK